VAGGLCPEALGGVGLARAIQGAAQAGGVHRLEQVIDGPHVEGGHRVLGVGGTEDHHRAVGGPQRQGVQAGQARHLDVQHHHVHAAGAHPVQGLVGVGALAGQTHAGQRFQQAQQPAAGGGLVVHHQHLQGAVVGLVAGVVAHVGLPGRGPPSGTVSSATVRSPAAPMVRPADPAG
jgi:hypothetical protein